MDVNIDLLAFHHVYSKFRNVLMCHKTRFCRLKEKATLDSHLDFTLSYI